MDRRGASLAAVPKPPLKALVTGEMMAAVRPKSPPNLHEARGSLLRRCLEVKLGTMDVESANAQSDD